jgi:hypothetical protein
MFYFDLKRFKVRVSFFEQKTVFVLKKQFMKNDIVVRRKLCDKRKRTFKKFFPIANKTEDQTKSIKLFLKSDSRRLGSS